MRDASARGALQAHTARSELEEHLSDVRYLDKTLPTLKPFLLAFCFEKIIGLLQVTSHFLPSNALQADFVDSKKHFHKGAKGLGSLFTCMAKLQCTEVVSAMQREAQLPMHFGKI